MANIIVVLLIVAAVAAAVMYIRKEKKRGVRCVGCPAAGQCAMKQDGKCTCHIEEPGQFYNH